MLELFLLLLLKLVPVYLIIVIGLIAGRYASVDQQSIAKLAIFILSPLVVFNGLLVADLSFELLLLPVLSFSVCSLIAIVSYKFASRYWHDGSANLLGFTAGTGNTGYFGIPLILALVGEEALAVTVLIIMGFVLYENTVGYFIIARGRNSWREALGKLLKLPAVYAFGFGLLANYFAVPVFAVYQDFVNLLLPTYSFVGMMIIGLALSKIVSWRFDGKFLLVSFFVKFVLWPLVVLALIVLDQNFGQLFTKDLYKIFLIMALVPLAANTVSFAIEVGLDSQKAAVTVFLSTVFALVYIPVVMSFT